MVKAKARYVRASLRVVVVTGCKLGGEFPIQLEIKVIKIFQRFVVEGQRG